MSDYRRTLALWAVYSLMVRTYVGFSRFSAEESFSPSTLSTLGAGVSLLWGCPVCCWMVSRIPGLSLGASSISLLSCDNHKCPQALPNVLGGGGGGMAPC